MRMYNPFAVVNKSRSKTKPKPKPKSKIERKGLTNANEKKLDNFYAKGFVKLSISR